MMGSEIVVASNPRGMFLEGIVDGTPKPGTLMQIKAGVEPVGGRHTWEVFNGAADGEQCLMAILREDHLQGKSAEDAYADGDRCFLYVPVAGEEMNVLVGDVAGTAATSDFAIGDKLMHDDTTGKFVDTTGTPESEPFIVLETITDMVGDTLVHVMATGQ